MRPAAESERAELSPNSALSASGSASWPMATPPVPHLTAAQMADVDRRTVRYGISLLQMMELAGRNLAEHARWMLGGSVSGRKLVVLCGTGNNGGGGMVSARHLHGWGAKVYGVLVGAEANLKPVPERQWRILKRLGLAATTKAAPTLGRLDLIVDALFGYGFHGRMRPQAARWIEWAIGQRSPTLALDVPSGLDATTGIPSRSTIRATSTLTLALPKTGLRAPGAAAHVGHLYLADIGIPFEVYRDLGLEVVNLFEKGPILRLAKEEESPKP